MGTILVLTAPHCLTLNIPHIDMGLCLHKMVAACNNWDSLAHTDGVKTTELEMTVSPVGAENTNKITAGVTITVTMTSMNLDKDEIISDASMETPLGKVISLV